MTARRRSRDRKVGETTGGKGGEGRAVGSHGYRTLECRLSYLVGRLRIADSTLALVAFEANWSSPPPCRGIHSQRFRCWCLLCVGHGMVCLLSTPSRYPILLLRRHRGATARTPCVGSRPDATKASTHYPEHDTKSERTRVGCEHATSTRVRRVSITDAHQHSGSARPADSLHLLPNRRDGSRRAFSLNAGWVAFFALLSPAAGGGHRGEETGGADLHVFPAALDKGEDRPIPLREGAEPRGLCAQGGQAGEIRHVRLMLLLGVLGGVMVVLTCFFCCCCWWWWWC